MTLVTLPNRASLRWAAAQQALDAALPRAGHPRLTGHARLAQHLLMEAGQPTRVWANRIAAIAVIAARRADTAPTAARRAAYLDVADAATDLLALAATTHRVRPDGAATAVLAQLRLPDPDGRAALV